MSLETVRLCATYADSLCVAVPDTRIDSPWARHADQWHVVTSPLRPHEEDVRIVQSTLNGVAQTHRAVHTLLLGVTPELTQLDWPTGSTLLAMDASHAMIARHWTAPRSISATVEHGQWESLSTGARKFQLVLADGSFNILPNLASIRLVMEQVASVLETQGRFAVRVFTRPDIGETPAAVVDDMLCGRIGNVHIAKWRLAMALHGSLVNGVHLHSIWECFQAAVPNVADLARQTGWSVESINTIDNYRGVDARYFFPTLAEFRALLSKQFAEVSCHIPRYELGERCPTLVLRPLCATARDGGNAGNAGAVVSAQERHA